MELAQTESLIISIVAMIVPIIGVVYRLKVGISTSISNFSTAITTMNNLAASIQSNRNDIEDAIRLATTHLITRELIGDAYRAYWSNVYTATPTYSWRGTDRRPTQTSINTTGAPFRVMDIPNEVLQQMSDEIIGINMPDMNHGRHVNRARQQQQTTQEETEEQRINREYNELFQEISRRNSGFRADSTPELQQDLEAHDRRIYLNPLIRLIKPYVLKGRFVLTNNQVTDTYYDIKGALTDSKIRATIKGLFIENRIRLKIAPASIGCIESGGISIAQVLSDVLQIPYFVVRKEGKVRSDHHDYMKSNNIELDHYGEIISPVLVVDDVVTTMTSVLKVVKCVFQNGGEVEGILSLVNRDPQRKEVISYDSFDRKKMFQNLRRGLKKMPKLERHNINVEWLLTEKELK